VNELSAKINSYLKHVRGVYEELYNKGRGVYKSKEIRGDDIMITTENQTDKINSIIYTVTNQEMTRGYSTSTLDLVRGREFRPVLTEIYKTKGKEVGQVIELIINDFIKKTGNASSDIKRDFLTYSHKGRNKDPQIKVAILDLVKDKEGVNKSKFYTVYYKYICIRIYDVMVDSGL